MARAETVAKQLAYEFLANGQYSATGGPVQVRGVHAAAALNSHTEAEEFADQVESFAGLQIQSVGYESEDRVGKVHIYLSKGSVREMKNLPSEIDGVPVVVHKMGPISVRPNRSVTATNNGNLYVKDGRICCGSSCAPTSEQYAGTIGAIAKLQGRDQAYVLSNNHVLAACNHVPFNQPILAPATMDGRPNAPAPREIARHHLIHPLYSGDPYFVPPINADVALARIDDLSVLSSWQGDQQHGYDTPSNIIEPQSLMRVKKFGRTTGLTFGEIEACVNTPMPVTYQTKGFKGTVWFKDVWSIRATSSQHFALGGDSGSLVVLDDESAAVGILFAANTAGDYGWIVSMPVAAAALGGLTLVSNLGV